MSTGSVNGSGSANGASSSSSSASSNPLGTINANSFLQMLVTELQQQDPTQPMDSSQILDQVSQIEQIESSQQLSTSLNSVVMGQNLSAGAGLLNQNVTGLDSSGNTVSGVVSQVNVANGQVTLQVGNSSVGLANVTQITTNTN
jgi:flagellar basal-body rod modification protein FlgD